MENGDIFTIEEFRECCKSKLFIDSDGVGYYGTIEEGIFLETKEKAIPSHILDGVVKSNKTHIIWYNK